MQNIFLQPSNSRNSFVGHPYNRFRQSRQLEESKVSRESRSNVSTTSSDYDPKSCSWEIAIGESIYDDALIRPLVVYHHLHSGRPIDMRHGLCMNIVVVFVMLLFNSVLQCLVLWKIRYVSLSEIGDKETLFEACKLRSPGEMPYRMRADAPAGNNDYLDCGPLAVTMMSAIDNLDADGDGYWTFAEAASLGEQWQELYGKVTNLRTVFKRLRTRAEKGKMLSRTEGEASSEQGLVGLDLKNISRGISLSWLRAQQREFDLCLTANSYVCGNLEARGILVDILGSSEDDDDDDESGAHLRILRCARIVDKECPDIFGQLFVWYHRVVLEACGDRESGWFSSSVVTARFSKPIKYALKDGAVAQLSYAAFLGVILVIWLLVVMKEIRQVCSWWIVLLYFPTLLEGRDCLDDGGESEAKQFRVLAIPFHLKILQIAFNLFPRTLICLGLAYWGCDFLLYADDYDDLILNSVALGFLIEIDEMIFRGVAGEESRAHVESFRDFPLQVQLPCRCSLSSCAPNSLIMIVVITVISLCKMWFAYMLRHGKLMMADAYSCLCHAEGETCTAAQIFGGDVRLPSLAGLALKQHPLA
mmetsp:Transcript_46034/g.73504  ORF Transcript_46034/g.73504 Transcript_46034/m.73504 type:complete len:588 (-) Transcript_46034:56-1819(-)